MQTIAKTVYTFIGL